MKYLIELQQPIHVLLCQFLYLTSNDFPNRVIIALNIGVHGSGMEIARKTIFPCLPGEIILRPLQKSGLLRFVQTDFLIFSVLEG